MSKLNKLAVITGASSGIGEEFAIRLASDSYDLILTARREDKLANIKQLLEAKNNIKVEIIPGDLSKSEDISSLAEILREKPVHTLINNAGYSILGEFQKIPIEKHHDMMTVHMNAAVELTHTVLPNMINANEGNIINVSSISGFIKKSHVSFYGSTKAFLIHFSYVLQEKLKDTNISVQALCPGFTHTGFHSTPEYTKRKIDVKRNIPKFFWMSREKVVDISLKKLKKQNKVVVIPGFKNWLVIKLANTGLLKI